MVGGAGPAILVSLLFRIQLHCAWAILLRAEMIGSSSPFEEIYDLGPLLLGLVMGGAVLERALTNFAPLLASRTILLA